MSETKSVLVRSWLLKAVRDLKGARVLAAESDELLELAVYHCQQAAEKAIKGYLVFYDEPFRKIHDVPILLEQAAKIEPSFASWLTSAENLNEYSTVYRYPGASSTADLDEFLEAWDDAETIVRQVLTLLPTAIHLDRFDSDDFISARGLKRMTVATKTKRQEDVRRFLIHTVDWQQYETLCEVFADRGPRMTYDRGKVEFMSPSSTHERYRMAIGRVIDIITEELDIPMIPAGSTTFRREDLERGLEPDQCYYFERAAQLRDPLRIDLDGDPAPDLAIEIEVSRSALDRLSVYAALGVREVWRFDGEDLIVHILQADGSFPESQTSAAFPFLPMDEIAKFLVEFDSTNFTRRSKEFRAWVRVEVLPRYLQ
ncbi:MAG: hypothetical protein NVSMB14_09060 [Isosphaeraceae bacterium]